MPPFGLFLFGQRQCGPGDGGAGPFFIVGEGGGKVKGGGDGAATVTMKSATGGGAGPVTKKSATGGGTAIVTMKSATGGGVAAVTRKSATGGGAATVTRKTRSLLPTQKGTI